MSLRTQAQLFSSSAFFNGPASSVARLVDGIAAAPYEGLWTPTQAAKVASVELAGTFSAISVQLYGTNAADFPQNTQTITVSGSVAQNDSITTTFANPNLPGGSEAVQVTVGATPTVSTVAAQIAAAINADNALAAIGLTATAAAGVVTVSYPSQTPSQAAAGPAEFLAQPANETQITTTVNTGSETVAVALGADGQTIGSAITAAGITAVATMSRYIKARLTSLTGTIASMNYYGAA